ncbi:hypothetical protein QBC38DRAFT_516749 [Podospora fimiseda]|uniref:Carrier domain-containing protein n=1 Tax=Podospora fimiseda TaxID=252190 RepID=A0AAN7GSH3_9PEZI|nr:hypothetical protein QBC38DRAFT_516749 [Podospora fimiseda]
MFDRVRERLGKLLPVYMVPRLLLAVNKFPLTDSGKLDRWRAWGAVQGESEKWSRYLSSTLQIPLSTETEKQLGELWSQVLGLSVEKIGAQDDFFGSGGDSTTAMRLVNLAHQAEKKLSFTVADVFQYPIRSDLAALLDKNGAEGHTAPGYEPFSTLPTTLTAEKSDMVTMSIRKSRDVFAFLYLEGQGQCQVERWRENLSSVDPKIIQVVLKEHNPEMAHFVDTDDDMDSLTKTLLREDLNHSPQMSQPFFQVAIVTSPAKYRVIFCMAHSQYDAISMGYIGADLRDIYKELTLSVPACPTILQYIHATFTTVPEHMKKASKICLEVLQCLVFPSQGHHHLLDPESLYQHG